MPRWRARYDDDEWEDLSSRQVKEAMLLAEEIRIGAERAARLRGDCAEAATATTGDTTEPAMELVECPSLPLDFGSKYEGQLLRHRFDTGWSRGVIKKVTNSNPEQGDFTVLCTWPDTSGRADRDSRVKVRKSKYVLDRAAPPSSWNLLLWMNADRQEAEGQELQVPATDGPSKRQRNDGRDQGRRAS